MCLCKPHEEGAFAMNAEGGLATAPATGVNQGPGDLAIQAMLAPSIEDARAFIARLDQLSDDAPSSVG